MLGVEIRLDTAVGSDVSLAELRARHVALYVAIGAQAGRELGIMGEADRAVWNGADFLLRVNQGSPVEVGAKVAVIGGGNTAVDAAPNGPANWRRRDDRLPAFPQRNAGDRSGSR